MLLSKLPQSLLTLFSPVVLLFLFLLLELVLLKYLPELAKLWLVLEGASCDFFEVAPTCHGALVVRAQLRIQHHFSDLDVSQRLLAASEHEIAAGQIIEDTRGLDMLKS